jgi:hypothetical protein
VEFRQVVGLGRKTFYPVKFGHRKEAPVEPKAPTVIPASEAPLDSEAFLHKGTTMSANVAERMELVVEVASQQNLLVRGADFQPNG